MGTCNQLVLLCRPGFEKECAGEIIHHANTLGVPAYIQANPNSGLVFLVASNGSDAGRLFQQLSFRELVFARQWFATQPKISPLPEDNRLPPLLDAASQLQLRFHDIELDYPDTNEGKSLNRFCKQFRGHLLAALKKQNLLSTHADQILHVLFTDSTQAFVGYAPIDNSSPYAMGIPRLRMPRTAPSRSTLKLEEAIHWFVENESDYFKPGMSAVDLGAAPGGWSWQLVKRGLRVNAIDNGPMDKGLMSDGMVDHYRADAFTWQPEKNVDWLVCDMAERPLLVSKLIAHWFKNSYCRHAIFNLKLPMKKRLQAVNECRELLENQLNQRGLDYTLGMKQLYHDREEITACIITL